MVCKNRKLAYIVNDALNSWVNNDKTSELISYAEVGNGSRHTTIIEMRKAAW